nr:PREDICTED: reticulon-1 [Latimeria chalumnae]|eukprot:XP_014340512.1 PREDICTED: reticulon-1 [Latimeria chalumnae]
MGIGGNVQTFQMHTKVYHFARDLYKGFATTTKSTKEVKEQLTAVASSSDSASTAGDDQLRNGVFGFKHVFEERAMLKVTKVATGVPLVQQIKQCFTIGSIVKKMVNFDVPNSDDEIDNLKQIGQRVVNYIQFSEKITFSDLSEYSKVSVAHCMIVELEELQKLELFQQVIVTLLLPERKAPPPRLRTRNVTFVHDEETEGSDCGILGHQAATNSVGDEGTFYTSLISDHHYTTQQDSFYFTGSLQKESIVPGSYDSEENNASAGSFETISSLESHGMFSSDSGIETMPAESVNMHQMLTESTKQDYKYIDVSQSEKTKPQETTKIRVEEKNVHFASNTSAMPPKVEDFSKCKTNVFVEERLIQGIIPTVNIEESSSVFADEPHGGKVSDDCNASTPEESKTSVKIETSVEPDVQKRPQYNTGMKLKPGPDVVPTVMVSEPEDDSPGSITPPFSGTEESDSQTEGIYHILEDELCGNEIKRQAERVSPMASPEKKSLSPTEKQHGLQQTIPGFPPIVSAMDYETSSAESGDSEIELVSEEPLAAEEATSPNYMSLSQIGGPLPSPVSTSVQYSILREEREAELDSELIIESCDASSASDESPKREQDSPVMKPATMDMTQEESTQTVKKPRGFQLDIQAENKNMNNTTESSVYLKYTSTSVTPEVRVEEPSPEEDAAGTKNVMEGHLISRRQRAKKGSRSELPLTSSVLQLLGKQRAVDLLYWRDVKHTGILFGSVLLLLFSLTQFSVVSVIAYLALAALSATISFRIYKSVLQAVQKTDEGHPFKYQTIEIIATLAQMSQQKCFTYALHFAVLMWLLTYVGALFNGLTLLIMAVISLFTLPVVYDKYQAQIDQYLGLVRTNVNSVVAK